MRVRREYTGWDPSDRLDPEADAVLAFLDELSLDNALCGRDEVIASIDDHGVVRAESR